MKAVAYIRPPKRKPYTHTMFLDSGAYGLYNIHVRKMHVPRIGKTGRELELPKVMRGRGDFSYYSLKPGSAFRKYCDQYGRWLRRVEELGADDMLYVNIDVITNPKMTWEVQQYLEQEHGVHPVPVIHAGTPFEIIQKYMDTGRYPLIGLGGLGQNIGLDVYRRWADGVFTELCPASNKHRPIVRVHGFAMTSWEFICRWPWWSVDSATWVKLAAYGWLYIPYWSEGTGWDHNCPPIQINVSFRSPFLRKKDRHVMTAGQINELIARWLKRCDLPYGSVTRTDTPTKKSYILFPETITSGEVENWGVQSHFAARACANLFYLKDLEESRPEWPNPLDLKEVWQGRVKKNIGFGI